MDKILKFIDKNPKLIRYQKNILRSENFCESLEKDKA